MLETGYQTATESQFSDVQCKQIRTTVGISNEYSQALKRRKVFEMEAVPNSVAADYSNITHLTDSFKDLWTGIASPPYFTVV